jgi:hypothetical protein
MTISADHPAWGDDWVVRRPARYGNVAGAGAAVRQQVRAFRANAERRWPCPSSGGSCCCHLDRDRVLARPRRWPEGPQLHRVLHLQPVLLPGRTPRRLPRARSQRNPCRFKGQPSARALHSGEGQNDGQMQDLRGRPGWARRRDLARPERASAIAVGKPPTGRDPERDRGGCGGAYGAGQTHLAARDHVRGRAGRGSKSCSRGCSGHVSGPGPECVLRARPRAWAAWPRSA